jgi:hypothetical protein
MLGHPVYIINGNFTEDKFHQQKFEKLLDIFEHIFSQGKIQENLDLHFCNSEISEKNLEFKVIPNADF